MTEEFGKLQRSQTSLLLPLGLGPALLIIPAIEMMEVSGPSTLAAPEQPAGRAQVTVNSLSQHSCLWMPTLLQMLMY